MLVAVAVFACTLVLVIRQPKGLGVGWSATIGALIALAVGAVFANDGAALILTPIVMSILLALRFSPAATLARKSPSSEVWRRCFGCTCWSAKVFASLGVITSRSASY
jgi:Na+/H+ antiporter NhaD/arsenite permease-like protein